MKALKAIAAALAAMMMFTSCGALKKVSDSVDFTNGSKAGTVLAALATQYFTTGKIDFSNVQNILNVVTLANTLSSLKSDSNQAQVDFGNGLMSTNNMVNNNNLGAVLGGLSGLANLNMDSISNSLQKGTQTTETQSLTNQLTGLLGLLKK